MEEALQTCPNCGAPLEPSPEGEYAAGCDFCGWSPDSAPFPSSAEVFRRHSAETLPLPKTDAETFELSTGEGEKDSPEARQRDKPEFRRETVKRLRGAGYHVTEDTTGDRITAIPQSGRRPSELSPSDVVKMAAELDGGVKPQGKLPLCPGCQAASPIGSAICQWCGEPFPRA